MTIENSLGAYGRDPWVIRHRDTYYYCFTDAPHNTRLFVASSKTISGLSGAPAVCVWQAPEEGPYSGDYWAPELHHIGSKWFIYIAAGNKNQSRVDYQTQRMHVLAALSSNPQGEYTYAGKLADTRDRFAIDGTILNHRGKKYFVWSGWEEGSNSRQVLYIARMKNPLTLVGEGVKISEPEHEWEKRSQPHVVGGVNEGPQILKRKNKIHIIYSASGSWTDEYCLGQLTLVGEDPLSPASWAKHHEPIFASHETLFAPGHACFVHDPISRKHFVIYHASSRKGAGWETHVRAQVFNWNPENMPILGIPR